MFIANVESMKGQDIFIPSLVRLHSIDNKTKKRGRYYHSIQHGFKLFSLYLGEDREFAMGGNFREQSTPSKIKCASQVVDCIANNQGNIGSQETVSKSVVEELFPRIAIMVQAGAVTVRRGAESLLDIRDVLLGPFDL